MTEERATYEIVKDPYLLVKEPVIWWMGFSLDTTPADAKAAFVHCYGEEPQNIIIELGLMYVGPVPTRAEE